VPDAVGIVDLISSQSMREARGCAPLNSGWPGDDDGERLRILIADGDADVADMLTQMMKLLGHEAVAAFSLREAVDARRSGHFDACVIDLEFPDCGGLALLGSLRRAEGAGWRARAIAWTASPDLWRARPAADLFDAFVAKPASLETLIAAVSGLPCPNCWMPLDRERCHVFCQWPARQFAASSH